MPVITVNLTHDEKERLISFVKGKKENISKRLLVVSGDLRILDECKARPPSGATDKWINDLAIRSKEYAKSIKDNQELVTIYSTLIESIKNKNEIEMSPSLSKILYELYNKEREKKHIEPKYAYYPRLKKIKEESMYVFSNKIKIIMEAEYVKVA